MEWIYLVHRNAEHALLFALHGVSINSFTASVNLHDQPFTRDLFVFELLSCEGAFIHLFYFSVNQECVANFFSLSSM